PMAGWNGKYTQLGNGGWAGSTPYRQMIDPCVVVMQRRAPTTVTKAVMARPWAIGHPEKLIDFGYRAVHETSVQAKAIVCAFYGRDIQKSRINWLTHLSPIRLQPSVF